MVIASEACCPSCFNRNQYSIKLERNGCNGNGSREFECPHCKTVFLENDNGFLVRKECNEYAKNLV
ncbi:MAG: hypothetical protein HZB67_01670 [Candidatus Aenigmarchaeota archaeon]|nr:hypothetical protein [Candidatus Aenigmarchaeota archaeon]MBI5228576.1 hypothetical protein [Candidatus Micrarchaeota archaeon]